MSLNLCSTGPACGAQVCGCACHDSAQGEVKHVMACCEYCYSCGMQVHSICTSARMSRAMQTSMRACKVCNNTPDEEGVLRHGRGCYVISSEGGGDEFIDL